MDFRTIVKTDRSSLPIDHTRPVMFLGSCFSDNIGSKMRRQAFDVTINPLGALYNPLSILSAVDRFAHREYFSDNDLREVNGLFVTLDAHSKLSTSTAEACLEMLNKAVDEGANYLRRASHIFITLGTAWVFFKDGRAVANCHKLPADEFTRRRIDITEIVESLKETVKAIHSVNLDARIWFTVSPIRHMADGAHGNQLSKSSLLLAIENVVESDNNVAYFPAYEIMMDDLRDYRFYADDMCHPSAVAIDYIYQRFGETFYNPDTIELARRCEKIVKRMQHRPITDNPQAIERFNSDTSSLISTITTQYPQLKHNLTLLCQQANIPLSL